MLKLYIFAIISKMEHFSEKCMRETMIPLVWAMQILINAENIWITLYISFFKKFLVLAPQRGTLTW